MNQHTTRRNFLVTTGVGGFAIITSKARAQQDYSIGQLVGKSEIEHYGDGFNLLKEAAEAFDDMRTDAGNAGFNIYSVSSYRSYEHQKRIWNRKYSRNQNAGMTPADNVLDIVRYSTIPGTSRHHWATEVDIIDTKPPRPASSLNAKNFLTGGAFEGLYQWLLENANQYGFYEVYTNTEDRTGFNYEPWHWSYLKTAKPMLESYLNIDWQKEINSPGLLGYEAIKEFLPRYKKEWILGINPVLLPDSVK